MSQTCPYKIYVGRQVYSWLDHRSDFIQFVDVTELIVDDRWGFRFRDDVRAWMEENLQGWYCIDASDFKVKDGIVRFTVAEDAMLFKLTWSGV